MAALDLKNIETICFEDVGLSFSDGNEIFRNVSFKFPTNECVWVQSAAGEGKSLLLKILMGLVLPTSGEVCLNDDSVGNMSFSEFLPYRVNIGYSFDFGGLLSNQTIEKNLMLPVEYHNVLDAEKRQERVDEFLKMFDMYEVRKRRPSGVTGGVRKAACVARSLIMKPEMLLLDEPTAGLRNEPRSALMDYLKSEFETGRLKHIFITSHDQKFLDHVCTKKIEVRKEEFLTKDYERFYPAPKVGNL